MAQIIPRGRNFGQELGSALGELAGLKLAQVVKKHQQEKERSNFVEQFTPILGKDSANFLSTLAPEERRNALRDIESLTGAFQQPGQQTGLGALAQQNRGFGQQQQPNQQPNIQQAIKQYFGQPQAIQQFGMEQPEEQMMQQEYQQATQESPQTPQINPEKAKLLRNIYETPQERAAREKQEFQQRQINLKETKPYIDNLKAQEKAAKEGDLRLKRMENLINKGNLPNSALWSALTKVEETPIAGAGVGAALGSIVPGIGTALGTVAGGIIGGLTSPFAGAIKTWIKSGSPDIEEFEKLSTDFVKNAKQYFGPRITDADLRIFMQTIPTLMQTDAGKKKVIDNLRSLNELAQIEAKAARSIIKAHQGIPPIDLEQQVKDKISDKIDKVAEEFIVR